MRKRNKSQIRFLDLLNHEDRPEYPLLQLGLEGLVSTHFTVHSCLLSARCTTGTKRGDAQDCLFLHPPRWGRMVLATSRTKTQDIFFRVHKTRVANKVLHLAVAGAYVDSVYTGDCSCCGPRSLEW